VNAPRVLLLTVRGPEGQVDVAAREDASVADLVTAVSESLGDTGVAATDSLDDHPEPPPSAERSALSAERTIPKTATLAQAGLLDGHVLTVSNDVVTVDDQVFASADGSR
jgi:WXG100 protein secretion system (Wss), protein YukD